MDDVKTREEIIDLKTTIKLLEKKIDIMSSILEEEGLLRKSDIDERLKND